MPPTGVTYIVSPRLMFHRESCPAFDILGSSHTADMQLPASGQVQLPSSCSHVDCRSGKPPDERHLGAPTSCFHAISGKGPATSLRWPTCFPKPGLLPEAFFLHSVTSVAPSESKHLVEMDPDVHKVTILFIFHISLFNTLECMSRDEGRFLYGTGTNCFA